MTPEKLLEAAQAAETFAAKLRALAGAPASSTRGPAPQQAPGDEPRAPFGRSKGEPLASLETNDLEWLGGAIERSINDPDKAKYRRKNEADLANVRAELAARKSGVPRSPEPETPGVEGGVADDDIPF